MYTHQFQSWKNFTSLFYVCDIVRVTDFLCHHLTFIMQAYHLQRFENWIYILALKRKTTESLCRKCHHGKFYHFRFMPSIRKLGILFRSAKLRVAVPMDKEPWSPYLSRIEESQHAHFWRTVTEARRGNSAYWRHFTQYNFFSRVAVNLFCRRH